MRFEKTPKSAYNFFETKKTFALILCLLTFLYRQLMGITFRTVFRW